MMKNPLNKRYIRELKAELGKYLVIFLLMTGTIGFVSGFLVADGSMIAAYDESFEKYNIEHGNFRTSGKLANDQKKAVEDLDVTLYDNFYMEEELANESVLRIFKERTKVNKVCLMEGDLPEHTGEIAVDRMYADNNDIHTGDILEGEGREYKVTGLVALPDYSCLFSDNSDSMFDAVKFGVAVAAEDFFEEFDEDKLVYSYSWLYDKAPEDDIEEKKKSDEFMEELVKTVPLEDYVPRYLNQAIQFTGEDMGSDRSMMILLLYIIMVILAFVFAVTISNTINKESRVIGTLRASGYTRRELLLHYMLMPFLVTLAGALIGNVLGYTWFKDVTAGMYYGSYSLTTYVTLWNGEAFLLTTVVPVLLMIIINYVVLSRRLKLSPLKFIRGDLTKRKQRRAVPLPVGMRFFDRFRLRIIFQNMGNYMVLLFGILFANLLLMFGLLIPSALDHYRDYIENHMLSEYQYILKTVPYEDELETENGDAEKFSAYTLRTLDSEKYKSEDITLYGIEEGSRYIDLDIDPDKKGVYLSSAYASKYRIGPGDKIRLKEKYENKTYSFQVAGIFPYESTLSVYMPIQELNETFDRERDYFNGYFSDSKITDIKEEYIKTVIDKEDLTKLSRQLDVSMGGMMRMVNLFAVIMFMILIYLLSKVIIEKNAQSISLAKILGYTDCEISRLYIAANSIVVIALLILSLPVTREIMEYLFREIMLSKMSGWITFYVDPVIYIQMLLMGIGTYGAVSLLEYRRVRRIRMDAVLKNVE